MVVGKQIVGGTVSDAKWSKTYPNWQKFTFCTKLDTENLILESTFKPSVIQGWPFMRMSRLKARKTAKASNISTLPVLGPHPQLSLHDATQNRM